MRSNIPIPTIKAAKRSLVLLTHTRFTSFPLAFLPEAQNRPWKYQQDSPISHAPYPFPAFGFVGVYYPFCLLACPVASDVVCQVAAEEASHFFCSRVSAIEKPAGSETHDLQRPYRALQ